MDHGIQALSFVLVGPASCTWSCPDLNIWRSESISPQWLPVVRSGFLHLPFFRHGVSFGPSVLSVQAFPRLHQVRDLESPRAQRLTRSLLVNSICFYVRFKLSLELSLKGSGLPPRRPSKLIFCLGIPLEPIAYHNGFLDMTLMNFCLPALDFQTSTFKFKTKWWLFVLNCIWPPPEATNIIYSVDTVRNLRLTALVKFWKLSSFFYPPNKYLHP